jgi:hypothetical protein
MPYVLKALGDGFSSRRYANARRRHRSFFEGMRDLVYPTIAESYLADGTTF